MRISIKFMVTIAFVVLATSWLSGEDADRKTAPGNGPYGVPQATFRVHRLGADHAEGVTSIDMNGDGRPDLVSGAYWYENPGPDGGEWTRHQFRKVGILGEFVSDCGEWAIDVNHDGAPDVVTTGWMVNGVWWFENPKKLGAAWQPHKIADSYDTEGGAMGDINGDGHPDLDICPLQPFRNSMDRFLKSRAEGPSRWRTRSRTGTALESRMWMVTAKPIS